MIYVYVDSNRMAYIKRILNAKSLIDKEELKQGDTIIFPLLDARKSVIPLKKGELRLSTLEGYHLFIPFPLPYIKETNDVHYYMREESVIQQNAKLTAIGLLAYLANLDISLHDVCVDIIGYGRCGKEIYQLCKSLDIASNVIRRVKKEEIFIDYEEYKSRKKGSIIVNTAPENFLELSMLDYKDTRYIIDISTQHCFPKDWERSGIKILYPGSLPTIYAAYSSAALIVDYVREKLNEK